jgi:hypothetical protein
MGGRKDDRFMNYLCKIFRVVRRSLAAALVIIMIISENGISRDFPEWALDTKTVRLRDASLCVAGKSGRQTT